MRSPHFHRSLAAFVAFGLALVLSTAAAAQVLRPSESLYLQLRGGATAYLGDLNDDVLNPDPGSGLEDPGLGIGAEIGYLFNPNVSFGLGFVYHDLPITNGIAFDGEGERFVNLDQSGTAYQLQGLFRYSPLTGRVAPFIEAGGALVFGQGTEAGRNSDSSDEDVLGYGPVGGLGVDIALSSQLGLVLGAQSTFVFPDVALDNADVGAFGFSDDADYDVLATLHGGLRYAFRAPHTPVAIARLDCPRELTAGESGTFSLRTNADATPPVSVSWTWDDGSTGAGRTASHTYRTPGTYTVTATARGDYNEEMETCLVTVVEPQIAPTLSACRISPMQVAPNEPITFTGTVNSDASQPVTLSVDWGNGGMSSGATFPATNAYRESGTYTVTATAQNAFGSDSCTATIEVVDLYCSSVTELNSVYFEFGSSALTASAQTLLDENLDELRRCPDLCVSIRGYADDRETDQLRLSQRRANAIRDYYISNGVDIGRFRAEGLGEDPAANSKEDPGPGDSRARRGDSVPATCGTFTPTGTSRR
ncbi:MAG: PKD domain-containing protein [Bacteroidota bacterium]